MIESVKWIGNRIHVRKTLDWAPEHHEVDIYYPSEAMGLLMWLYQDRDHLMQAYQEELRKNAQQEAS